MPYVRQQSGIGTLAHPFYVGDSWDDKPEPTDANATLFEVDTRRTFVWRNRQWALLNEPKPEVEDENLSVVLLSGILSEIKSLRLGMIEAGACKKI